MNNLNNNDPVQCVGNNEGDLQVLYLTSVAVLLLVLAGASCILWMIWSAPLDNHPSSSTWYLSVPLAENCAVTSVLILLVGLCCSLVSSARRHTRYALIALGHQRARGDEE